MGSADTWSRSLFILKSQLLTSHPSDTTRARQQGTPKGNWLQCSEYSQSVSFFLFLSQSTHISFPFVGTHHSGRVSEMQCSRTAALRQFFTGDHLPNWT